MGWHLLSTSKEISMTTIRSNNRTGIQAVWQSGAIVVMAIAVGLLVNQVRPSGLPLMADWSPEARLKAASGDSMVIPIEQAVEFYHSQEAVFVDARSPELYDEGHIPGAVNVPWEQVNEYLPLFFDRVPDFNEIVIAYCDGDTCSLSEHLALMLREMGYANVKVLVNGWTVWQEKNLPVEKGGRLFSERAVSAYATRSGLSQC